MAHNCRRGFTDVSIFDVGDDGAGPLGWAVLLGIGAASSRFLVCAFPYELGLSFFPSFLSVSRMVPNWPFMKARYLAWSCLALSVAAFLGSVSSSSLVFSL